MFASFPESHSRKPALDYLLERYLPNSAKKLEMFARDLKSDWTSWGNEPLKFQNSSRFCQRAQMDLSLKGAKF